MRCGARDILILLMGLALSRPMRAETHVNVDIGWGERARAGTWTPLFVTVSDATPRNAVMRLHAPHDSSMGMRIAQPIAIGPSEQTYVMYAPLINSWGEPVTLEIRDASSGKLLFNHALLDQNSDDSGDKHRNLFRSSPGSVFIGVSGRKKALGQLENGANGPEVTFLAQEYLPESAKGYDALDILFLNQPDFSALRSMQQNAMLDWVRAGGHLVLCPSEDPISPTSALARELPCDIGDVVTLTASAGDLRQARLPERFGKFKARLLTPRKRAIAIPLLGPSGAKAIRGGLGLGWISVISFDASDLMFNITDDANRYWTPILDATHRKILGGGAAAPGSQQIQEPQRAAAAGQIIDALGNVPGVGSFGFKYVAMVLLGMMVLVGPVDWFVLKKMGRQHWTWVTTLGWIGLITTGAIFIGSIFRSGDLHYRTMQVIDQADGAAIARTDVIGIYSPKTDDYKLDVPAGGWWEPISTDQYSYNGRGMMQSVGFMQDGRAGGNIPDEMTVNVWNLRFLSSDAPEKGDAMLAATLTLDQTKSKEISRMQLTGTITNLGTSTIQHLWLRLPTSRTGSTTELSRGANWPQGGLAPKATLKIDTNLAGGIGNEYWASNVPANYDPYNHAATQPVDQLSLVKAACDLSTRRARLFNDRMSDADAPSRAIIYALSESATSVVKLIDHPSIEKHWQVVRALVPLKQMP